MKSLVFTLALLAALAAPARSGDDMNASTPTETATFAGGCFWCIEEIFRQQPGVLKVVSGYTGGGTKNPTYRKNRR